VNVASLSSGVAALATGFFHSCAATTGGRAKCWGYNLNGRLGDGTTTNRLKPVYVTGFGPPDLRETVLANPPASASQGASFNVTDTTKNEGDVLAAASTTRYYVSLDKLKDTSDVLLTGSRAVPALAVGATSSGTVSVTVPLTTPLGTYYLLACADDLKVVPESKEGNNCRAATLQVQVTP
jgi:hypothetical protein